MDNNGSIREVKIEMIYVPYKQIYIHLIQKRSIYIVKYISREWYKYLHVNIAKNETFVFDRNQEGMSYQLCDS